MKKTTALDLEYLGKSLTERPKGRTSDQRGKTHRQVCRNNCKRKQNKLTYTGIETNVNFYKELKRNNNKKS